MGKVYTGSWVGQRAHFGPAGSVEGLRDYGSIGVACEQLLQANFSQTAYLAGDLLEYGYIRPETKSRTSNELVGIAIEKLGKPFCTELEYSNSPNGLVAENGETLRSLNERGLDRALQDQVKDPRFGFAVERRRADLALLDFVEDELAVGDTVIVSSACPSADELQIPQKVLEDAHYQPELDQAMVWVITKHETGIVFKTINLFHAEPEILAQVVSAAASQPVAVESRERTPWVRTVVRSSSEGVEDKIISAFDQLLTQQMGEETFHGLTGKERGTASSVGTQELAKDEQFTRVVRATEAMLEALAESIVGGISKIPKAYLQRMLELKKPDGEYELGGERRRATIKLLNEVASTEEAMTAYQAVHTAACSALWATIDQVYRSQGGENSASYGTGGSDAAMGGLDNLQASRDSNSAEYGCPGDSGPKGESKSIFDMGQSEIASTLFGRKVIQTNCPKCETKGVEAVVEHGTITCKTCDACVDVCTGRTLRSARFSKRAAKISKQAWSLFGAKSKDTKKQGFKIFDFSKIKQVKTLRSVQNVRQ